MHYCIDKHMMKQRPVNVFALAALFCSFVSIGPSVYLYKEDELGAEILSIIATVCSTTSVLLGTCALQCGDNATGEAATLFRNATIFSLLAALISFPGAGAFIQWLSLFLSLPFLLVYSAITGPFTGLLYLLELTIFFLYGSALFAIQTVNMGLDLFLALFSSTRSTDECSGSVGCIGCFYFAFATVLFWKAACYESRKGVAHQLE